MVNKISTMKTIQLSATLRSETGKKAAKATRKSELIPAIIYGGQKNIMISIGEKDMKKVVYTPDVFVVKLNVDGETFDTIVKEIQFHPVSDAILHVDFYQVSNDKNITIALPVVLIGQAEGTKQGGKLIQVVRKLKVNGLVKNLPENISIDVTQLELGKSIKVGDLSFKGYTLVDPMSTVIASVKSTRAARETQPTEAAPQQ